MDFESNAVDLESLDGSRTLGRRSFLIGALATGAAASAPINYAAAARRARRALSPRTAPSTSASPSGFPRPRGIVLWTHLDEVKRNTQVQPDVAKDRKFSNVVLERGLVIATQEARAHRAHVRQRPRPARAVLLPLRHRGLEAPRSAASAPRPRWTRRRRSRSPSTPARTTRHGFFNAQRAIANEKDVDLVVCLGDYIYEYSDNDGVRAGPHRPQQDGDVQFLDEYRQKYTLYKSDKDLQAMHAAHPFIAVWDDHEVEDNHADGQRQLGPARPQQDQPTRTYPRRISYLQRRANGYKAFFNFHAAHRASRASATASTRTTAWASSST